MYTNTLPRKQCKSHSGTKCDADPDYLFRVRCTKCDYVRDFSQNGAGAAKYLYHRRRTRAARGLLSVGAPLDYASAAFFCRTTSECGIISNTAQPHVSFVEGLVPEIDHSADILRLRNALFQNPTLAVVSVHRVARRDNVTDLILADVILSPGADCAATQLSDGRLCKLPQFPFHVALGTCLRAHGRSKRSAAWAEARLRGMTMAVDPRRVRVLPPPDGGKRQKQPKGQQWQHQPKREAAYRPPQKQQRQGCAARGVTAQYVAPETQSVYSEPEADNGDAVSTSVSSSSSSEEQDDRYPGLAVDLSFLDESDQVPSVVGVDVRTVDQRCVCSVPAYQNSFVPPKPASIWAQA